MTADSFRKATADAARYAIGNLIDILQDASKYLETGNDLAAWGTLVCFDEAADDLKAAIRLHRAANRKGL